MSVPVELLNASPGLGSLRLDARLALAAVGHEVTFGRNERISSVLEPPDRILVVLRGMAKLVGVSPRGIERILCVFRRSDVIGSRLLLDDSVEALYPVIAMVPLRAVAIGKTSLMSVTHDHPECMMFLAEQISRQLAQAMDSLLLATSTAIPVRLCKLLLDFAEDDGFAGGGETGDGFVPLTHHLTHDVLAQIVGASRPHTSTALGLLESMGGVRRRSARGMLVRPERLASIFSQKT